MEKFLLKKIFWTAMRFRGDDNKERMTIKDEMTIKREYGTNIGTTRFVESI
jgi:hypothetical protein